MNSTVIYSNKKKRNPNISINFPSNVTKLNLKSSTSTKLTKFECLLFPPLCLSLTDALTVTTTMFSPEELLTFYVFAARWISVVQGDKLFQNLMRSMLQNLLVECKEDFTRKKERNYRCSRAWGIMQSLQMRLFVWYWNSFHVWQERISHLPLK